MPAGLVTQDSPLDQRIVAHKPAKQRIARAAATLIRDGETLMVNGGSTTLAFASELGGHRDVTIVTNNLQVPAVVPLSAVRDLYGLCRAQKLFEARKVQERVAALRQAVKPGGVASLKAAMRVMDRDCGEPRPPLLPLDAVAYQKLVGELGALAVLEAEPRGW